MGIGELAELACVAPRTIRYYEALGLLPEPPRTPSGYRDYDESAIGRLEVLRTARELGMSLQQIGQALPLEEDGSPLRLCARGPRRTGENRRPPYPRARTPPGPPRPRRLRRTPPAGIRRRLLQAARTRLPTNHSGPGRGLSGAARLPSCHHLAAGFGRRAAGPGTLIHPGPFALLRAPGAHLGTEPAQLRGRRAPPGQQRNARLTQVRAVRARADARGQAGIAAFRAVTAARRTVGDAFGEQIDQLLGRGVNKGHDQILPVTTTRSRYRQVQPQPSCRCRVNPRGARSPSAP